MRNKIIHKSQFILSSFLITAVMLAMIVFLLQHPKAAVSDTLSPNVTTGITNTVYLPYVTVPLGSCYYVETDDAVIIEIESAPIIDDWSLETSFDDYTGTGYYIWRGPNHYTDPGNGILTYPISLTKSGTYWLNIRNSHPTNPSLFNDVWVRFDEGPWIKSFSNIIDRWTYDFNFDQGGNLFAARFTNVNPGLHTIELSGRSTGFRLDRLVLSTNGAGQLNTEPESPCLVP